MADIKTVKVDKYNKDLRGCVSINRNSYPVKGTILDELVEVEVINGKNKTANLRKVVKPSKYRDTRRLRKNVALCLYSLGKYE